MGATGAILRLDIDGAASRGVFMPTSTLTKWGNSQGIILPKTVCDELQLKVGDSSAARNAECWMSDVIKCGQRNGNK